MKKAMIIGLVLVLLFSGLVLLPAPAHAVKTRATAPTEIEVLNVPFNSEEQVNKYIATGYRLTTDTIKNLSYSYDLQENAAKISVIPPYSGRFLLGGFTPALNTEISLDVKMTDYGFNNGEFTLLGDDVYLAVTNYPGGLKYGFYVYFYNDTGLQSISQNGPVGYYPAYIHISIHWYGNRTYHYSFGATNGTVFWQGWMKTRQDHNYTQQQSMFPPWLFFSFYPGSGEQNGVTYSMYIRNLTQIIYLNSNNDVFGYIPQKKYAAIGFDHILNGTYQNATPLLQKYGYKATWFFNKIYENDTTSDGIMYGWNKTIMKDLLVNKGMEFGIHLGYEESTYDSANISELNSEFSYLINEAESLGWHNSSFVWTSLGNGYAYEFNDYAWEHWNAIGREIWGHYDVNQGYLSNHDVGLNVQTAAEHGWSWIGYNHFVGTVINGDNSTASDMTVQQFDSFLANNSKNNIHVVGYFEYWSRYAAPEWVYGSLTKLSDANYQVTVNYNKFTVANGFKVAVKIPGFSSSSTQIYDETTHSYVHDFKVYDWGIVFEAHDGHTYEICNIVQQATNEIISMTTAIIPLFVLAMIVGMIGTVMKEMKRKW